MTATNEDAFGALQRFATVWHDKYDRRHVPGAENRKPPSLTMRANGVAAVLTEPQLQAVVAEYARMQDELKRLKQSDPLGTYYPAAEAFTAAEARMQADFETFEAEEGNHA